MNGHSVLIVDDESDMRVAIGNVLRLRGYEVLEAGEGAEALELVSKNNVSLILLDMRLTGMSSLSVLEKTRKIKGAVPVVMMVGYGHIHSAQEVLGLGASEYLQKPFENSQLIEVVKKFTSEDFRKRLDAETLARAEALQTTASRAGGNAVPALAPAADEADSSAARISGAEVKAGAWAKKTLGLYFSVVFLAVAALLLLRWNAARDTYRHSYSAGSANISALVWSGGELWAGDWVSGTVYRYAETAGKLELAAQYPLGKTHITSLAVAGPQLYVWDSWKKVLEVRRLDPQLTLLNSIPLPDKITGLARYEDQLWSCDEQGVAVLRSIDKGLSMVKTYRLAERPDQLYVDGKYLWTAVSSNGRLYRHKLDDALSTDKTYLIKGAGTDFPLSAFTWRGGRLWFALDGKSEITEIGKANLEEVN